MGLLHDEISPDRAADPFALNADCCGKLALFGSLHSRIFILGGVGRDGSNVVRGYLSPSWALVVVARGKCASSHRCGLALDLPLCL